jgi:uncharacterized membrane protein YgcG
MIGNSKRLSFATVLCAFFLFPFFALAEEKISLYEIDIDIHKDSSITVLETIHYDFGESSRRGIYRNIPFRYETPYGMRGVDISVVSVSRDGYPEEYRDTRDGSEREVRIGNPDVYIEGQHIYRITYEVEGAMNQFDGFDELYWNAIGTGWNVRIENAVARIDAPANILKAACYEGLFGANVSCRDLSVNGSNVVARSFDLQPGNGFTVALSLPSGVIAFPTAVEKSWRFAKHNAILLLPIVVFMIMFRLWSEHGKDARGRGTIIPQYSPPESVSPILMGAVIDGTLNNEDITAGILYLAEQGYLEIERTKKKRFLGSKIDYVLTWIGDYEELNHKEQLVAELIFGINVGVGEVTTFSKLQKDTSVATRRKRLENHIDADLQAQGFFANKPKATATKWVVVPIALIFAGVFFFEFFGFVGAGSILVSAIIAVIFGSLMPKLTKKGALAREHILGFKDFLKVTEKERMDFHNAPERSPKEFMEYLPFAIALGVEEKWAEQFKNMEMQAPSWYRGSSFSHFNSTQFTKDISSFSTSMSAGVTAAQGGSGSGGGGFSGGGMGGGGGGSW